eukprot:scaffold10306_cov75-Skeletonema_marinoi.AAC.15
MELTSKSSNTGTDEGAPESHTDTGVYINTIVADLVSQGYAEVEVRNASRCKVEGCNFNRDECMKMYGKCWLRELGIVAHQKRN